MCIYSLTNLKPICQSGRAGEKHLAEFNTALLRLVFIVTMESNNDNNRNKSILINPHIDDADFRQHPETIKAYSAQI